MRGKAGNGSRFAGALGVIAFLLTAAVMAGAAPLPRAPEHLIQHFNFAITPTKLSPTKPAPVRLEVSGKYRAEDGTHLPPATELRFLADRHLALDLKGVPGCKLPTLRPRLHPGQIESICRKSIVGRGEISVEVEFPDQPKTMVRGRLVLFRALDSPAGIDLVAHTFLTAPVTAEVVTTVDIRRVDKGRVGWEALLSIPKIAGGYGSLADYRLRIGKRFLSATCADGRFELSAVTTTTEGQWVPEKMVRPCVVDRRARRATDERPVQVAAGNLEALFNAGISPRKLSKTRPTRAAVTFSARFGTRDGTHVPALRHFRLLADKDIEVDMSDVPVCRLSEIRGRLSREAEAACGDASVGSAQVETVAAVSSRRLRPDVGPRLLAFNGGVRDGVTTLYLHTYLDDPVSRAFVATVKVKRVRLGGYGLLASVTLPRVVTPAVSVTSFGLRLIRGIRVTCSDGRVNADFTAVFANGQRLGAQIERSCTPQS